MSACSVISNGELSMPSVSSFLFDCVGLGQTSSFLPMWLYDSSGEVSLYVARMKEGSVVKSVRCN